MLDKVKPDQRSSIYTEITNAYVTLKDYDQVISFQEKATSSYSENSIYLQSTTEHGKNAVPSRARFSLSKAGEFRGAEGDAIVRRVKRLAGSSPVWGPSNRTHYKGHRALSIS
jgi:hypothetical protein